MSQFTIIPAVDLKGGKCVRLRQGRADQETVYGEDPVAMARHWQDEGARFLHVVDLDGAFAGKPVHDEIVLRIARELSIPVEVGGGIRTDEHIRRYLEGGIRRVIIGTRACASPEDLRALAGTFGAGIAAGIDARDGRVQVQGWTQTTDVRAVDLARQMAGLGVKTIVFTNTGRDGMLRGVDADAVGSVCDAASCDVISAGGITTAQDIAALRRLGRPNLAGAIVGKALYEGTVTLEELRRS